MIDNLDFIKAIKDAHSFSMGDVSLAEIFEQLASGEAQPWNVDGLYAVTTISHYSTHKICCIWLMGGKMEPESLAKGLALLEDFARHNGCAGIEVMGRRGWVRTLAPLGFSEAYTVVRKPLEAL